MSEKERLLRKLRGHLAYKKQVEPYKIFRDLELKLLLKIEPKTLEELAKIKGFPIKGKRVNCWGQSIIDIFNEPEKIENFEIELDTSGFPVSRTVLKKMEIF